MSQSQVLAIHDSELEMQMQRLHRFMVLSRWALAVISWVITLPIVFWRLQEEIALMQSHFTLASVRYALVFNLDCAIALGWSFGITTATLLWQSSNILFGLSPRYRKQLEKQVRRIRRRGKSHFLWRWVIRDL